MRTPRSRYAWRAYWLVVALHGAALFFAANGGALQSALMPVHRDMKVLDVARTPDTLCWDYASQKVVEIASDDLDTYLASPAFGRMVVAPYAAKDGMPWRVAAAPAVGPYRKRWCVNLPEKVPDGDPIRFDLTVYYPGPFGLWRAPLRWPPVEAPGMADAPHHAP